MFPQKENSRKINEAREIIFHNSREGKSSRESGGIVSRTLFKFEIKFPISDCERAPVDPFFMFDATGAQKKKKKASWCLYAN